MGILYNRYSRNELRKTLRRSMPKAEIILWQYLKGKQINGYKFRRQFGIGPYVVDFYCARLKLAIELDGDSHFEEDAQKYDSDRQKYIEEFKIKFIRFTNNDIYTNLDGVIQMIYKAVLGG
jgi:very-short-patch-repair endonuclease